MSIWVRIVCTLLPMGLVASGLIVLIVWTQQTDRFPLRSINIGSELHQVSENDIQTVVKPHLIQGFFGLDVEAVQKSLKQLPWVESAEVRRVWPDQLVVLIKEQTAQARWGEKGILSTEAVIFYPETPMVSDKLPLFMGPDERAKEMLQQYLSTLELLGPTGLAVRVLELSPSGVWQIMLDNGVAVILGKTGLNERTARFVQAYRNNLQMQIQRIAYVDLRYTNGFSIGWKAASNNAE